MPKSNNFQISIEWMYLPSFRWIDIIVFKLSSRKAYPSKKHIFGHVTSLIGWNVTAAYSKKFPRATAYTCQIWKESTQRSQSYKENKMRSSRSRRSPISSYTQTSVPCGTLNNTWCYFHNVLSHSTGNQRNTMQYILLYGLVKYFLYSSLAHLSPIFLQMMNWSNIKKLIYRFSIETIWAPKQGYMFYSSLKFTTVSFFTNSHLVIVKKK